MSTKGSSRRFSAGDGELVAERLRAHVMVQGKRFADLVESLEKLTSAQARLSA